MDLLTEPYGYSDIAQRIAVLGMVGLIALSQVLWGAVFGWIQARLEEESRPRHSLSDYLRPWPGRRILVGLVVLYCHHSGVWLRNKKARKKPGQAMMMEKPGQAMQHRSGIDSPSQTWNRLTSQSCLMSDHTG